METVVRFLMLRPADKSFADAALTVSPSPDLARAIGSDPLSAPALRGRIRGRGRTWPDHPLAAGLTDVAKVVYKGPAPDVDGLTALAAERLGESPDIGAARAVIGDALIAGKVLGTRDEPDLALLWRIAHVLDLLDRAARGELAGQDIPALLDRTVVVAGLPDRQPPQAVDPADGPSPAGSDAASRASALRSALDELMAVPATGLLASAPATVPAGSPPVVSEPPVPPVAGVPPIGAAAPDEPTMRFDLPDLGVRAATAAQGGPFEAPGSAPISTASPPPARMTLTAQAAAGLSPETRQLLIGAGQDLARLSVPSAVDALTAQLSEATAAGLDSPDQRYVRVGGRLRAYNEVVAGGRTSMPVAGGAADAAGVPTTHGDLAPVGVGDLLVVRQHLKGYEAVDLSYVENILPSENMSRRHKRSHTTETTVTIEVEATKQEELDKQSTERYELQSEADTVVKADASLKAGVSVTQWGPLVEYKANADLSVSLSRQESTKVATTYAKEVTTKATSKISQRTSEKRTVKTTDLYEEINQHGFDNRGSADAVVGQYQFLNKIYEAQVYNYGKRLLFDVMVPEPAAYLTALAAAPTDPNPDLVKPEPFTLKPSQLTEANYGFYVQKYGVAGVEPPPKPFTTVAPQPFDGTRENHDKPAVTKTALLTIPDGYRAVQAYGAMQMSSFDTSYIDLLWIQVGTVQWPLWPDSATAVGAMNDETDTLPVSVFAAGHIAGFVANVEITCRRTDRALDGWRLKTHAAITDAYRQLLREYAEKLAAFEAAQFSPTHGTNPAENLVLVRTELRRQVISILTEQYFDSFGALTTDASGVPAIDFDAAEAQGRYARFFEQAFEWEQIMYFLYPYYWATKGRWSTMVRAGDDDPAFRDFLRAGMARVVFAVRPGFEPAVMHFLETGQVWNGGDLPPITSLLYLDIVQEIREADQAHGAEVAQGDRWPVTLPTTLIKLRADATLPTWTHEPDGSWTAH